MFQKLSLAIYGNLDIIIPKNSGKAFGLSSMGIHLKACEKKWETQEAQKPAKQRRKIPPKPPGFDEVLVFALKLLDFTKRKAYTSRIRRI